MSKLETPEKDPDFDEDTDLYDADPDCKHDIVCASGGGIKCSKCRGWFCF